MRTLISMEGAVNSARCQESRAHQHGSREDGNVLVSPPLEIGVGWGE